MTELLPLFPLDVVLFPRMVLPLHIFEERYKEMIGECLRSKTPFGVLYAHDRTTERVGCLARILKVLKKYDDGRMDLLTRGGDRFEILHFDTSTSYLRGRTESFADRDRAQPPERTAVEGLLELYRETARILNRTEADKIVVTSDYQGLCFQIAAGFALPKKVKQRVLEGRSETERVTILTAYFNENLPRLRRTRVAAKRAGSNGHVR